MRIGPASPKYGPKERGESGMHTHLVLVVFCVTFVSPYFLWVMLQVLLHKSHGYITQEWSGWRWRRIGYVCSQHSPVTRDVPLAKNPSTGTAQQRLFLVLKVVFHAVVVISEVLRLNTKSRCSRCCRHISTCDLWKLVMNKEYFTYVVHWVWGKVGGELELKWWVVITCEVPAETIYATGDWWTIWYIFCYTFLV